MGVIKNMLRGIVACSIVGCMLAAWAYTFMGQRDLRILGMGLLFGGILGFALVAFHAIGWFGLDVD